MFSCCIDFGARVKLQSQNARLLQVLLFLRLFFFSTSCHSAG